MQLPLSAAVKAAQQGTSEQEEASIAKTAECSPELDPFPIMKLMLTPHLL